MLSVMKAMQEERSFQVSVRLIRSEYQLIENLVKEGIYRSNADFVREAVREKLRAAKIIGIGDVSPSQAEQMILGYLKKNPGSHYASKIAEELGLEYSATFQTIRKLINSGQIKKAKV